MKHHEVQNRIFAGKKKNVRLMKRAMPPKPVTISWTELLVPSLIFATLCILMHCNAMSDEEVGSRSHRQLNGFYDEIKIFQTTKPAYSKGDEKRALTEQKLGYHRLGQVKFKETFKKNGSLSNYVGRSCEAFLFYKFPTGNSADGQLILCTLQTCNHEMPDDCDRIGITDMHERSITRMYFREVFSITLTKDVKITKTIDTPKQGWITRLLQRPLLHIYWVMISSEENTCQIQMMNVDKFTVYPDDGKMSTSSQQHSLRELLIDLQAGRYKEEDDLNMLAIHEANKVKNGKK